MPTVTPTERPPFQRVFANSAADDDLIVGAHYYPWYSERTHWNEGRTDTPTRGDYDSRDLRTINQHIDEATGHGIDFFNISWWGPGSWEDNTLKDAILRADLIDDISFTIFYETLGRLIHTSGDVKVNLDNAANRATLVDDFKYLAEEYFDHPSYLRIDGKPVVVIYLTRTFTGDVAGAISHLRSELLSVGHDLFIVADEVYWQDPLRPEVIAGIRNYDAVFAYNMHYSQPEVGERFVERSLDHYRRWATATSKAGTDFIPGVMPGFDARYIRSPNPYVVERSAERFAQFTTGGLDLLGPHKILLVTSFNEWHEGTEIEPSVEHGYELLQALADSLRGCVTIGFSPPFEPFPIQREGTQFAVIQVSPRDQEDLSHTL